MKSTSNQQESYVRARDRQFFEGMRRGEAALVKSGNIFDSHGRKFDHSAYRSASDVGLRGSTNIGMTIAEDTSYDPKDSPLDIVLEPIGQSLSGRWTKTSSPLVLQSELNINYYDANESPRVSSPTVSDPNAEAVAGSGLESDAILRSYNSRKRQIDLSNVPLPHSAASFYSGPSPQMEVVESCTGVDEINLYLKARKYDVSAGIPGKFLHAVVGPDVADVGSVASTVMYAFHLDKTLKTNQLCTVPVINMKRADLDARADLQWLLDSCHVDFSLLIFIDEIDLSYYNLFGSLKLVLVNCEKIPSEKEALREAVVEVFNSKEDASCCTVIAEKFATLSPQILAGKGFSRLLLAGILLDTGNLTSPHCTSKDNYMATLLINGAGRFGFNGLHQILKYKSHDSLSDFQVRKILVKEFKKWTRSDSGKPDARSSRLLAPNVGMSLIGMSVAQLLSHNLTSIQDIVLFQKMEKLDLLMVVSGYYDSQKKFKREILVSAESDEVMKSILAFLNLSSEQLPLNVLHQPGLKDEMRVFEFDRVTSRRTIERLLEEYTSAAK